MALESQQGRCVAAAAARTPRRAEPASPSDDRCDRLDHWSRVQNCVDYVSFVRALPAVGPVEWQRLVAELSRLGRCELDGCGVVTARGRWGFFLIPPRGFPEMKVCFYRRSSVRQRVRRLRLLEACIVGQGRGNELG